MAGVGPWGPGEAGIEGARGGYGGSRTCDRTEVGLAEGWACAGSHALGVPLSAP